jgi:predicted dehydrogenase
MGCYSFAGVFKILGLAPPVAVEASTSESFTETYPKSSIVHLDYAGVHMVWYDGFLKPRRPAGLTAQDQHLFEHGQEGVMYVGEKGIIVAGFNGDHPHVYPESPKYQAPAQQRRGGPAPEPAIDQWTGAIKGGPPSLTNFEVQAPVTEAFLLGCLAQRFPGERFEWDTAAGKVTNSEKANGYLDPPARSTYRVV